METTQSEQEKEKLLSFKKICLRDLWDSIRCSNIHIIGVPEGEEREKGIKNVFEEIMAEKFPNL